MTCDAWRRRRRSVDCGEHLLFCRRGRRTVEPINDEGRIPARRVERVLEVHALLERSSDATSRRNRSGQSLRRGANGAGRIECPHATGRRSTRTGDEENSRE